MKKLITIVSLLLIILTLTSCSSKEKLTVYIPNDYINKKIVRKFEKENDVKVKILTFDSNEVALGQIKSNSYDVIIPSDYALEELAVNGYLEELNYKELLGDNFEFTNTLEDFLNSFKDEGFDILKYGIPYFFGTFGIIYNHKTVSLETLEKEGFNIISNQQLETVIYDSARDAFMVGMLVNNEFIHDSNLNQDKAINDAENWLKNAKGKKTSIGSDDIIDSMRRGDRYDAVLAYSGDAVEILRQNSNYKYYMPKYTNVWVDTFAIPKNSKNKDLAKEFIKFMSKRESVYDNSLEIGYSAVRKDVMDQLLKEEFNSDHIKYAYESKINDFQVFRYNESLKEKIDKAWGRVKAYK